MREGGGGLRQGDKVKERGGEGTTDLYPKQMKQAGSDRLAITWNDGHESSYAVRELRLECPCASCVDEWTRKKTLRADLVPLDIRPREIRPVGRYAIMIHWSDGHNTGIYSFELLRKLCPCPSCKKGHSED